MGDPNNPIPYLYSIVSNELYHRIECSLFNAEDVYLLMFDSGVLILWNV